MGHHLRCQSSIVRPTRQLHCMGEPPLGWEESYRKGPGQLIFQMCLRLLKALGHHLDSNGFDNIGIDQREKHFLQKGQFVVYDYKKSVSPRSSGLRLSMDPL